MFLQPYTSNVILSSHGLNQYSKLEYYSETEISVDIEIYMVVSAPNSGKVFIYHNSSTPEIIINDDNCAIIIYLISIFSQTINYNEYKF